MHDTKVRSRLKAQLTKFCSEFCEGLTKPLANFASQMLFGIQASQDVKLSHIARSLKEEIPLIKTEDRLSRNLKAAELEGALTPQLAGMAGRRVQTNTVLCLDLSDIRKEYARKMEYLTTIRDGSSGELHEGYWLCAITGAEVQGSEILPLYQKLYSTRARDFHGENAEVLSAIDLVRGSTTGRGIWTVDRGGDRKHLLEPLLDRQQRFVIRSTGKRTVIGRWHLERSVAEFAAKCRLRHRARIVKIQDGREKTFDLRFGVEQVRLPGRAEMLDLVDTPKDDVLMTQAGWYFLAAPAPARKTLFRQAIMKLRLFQMLTTRLAEAPDGRINADSVLEELGTLLPYDHPAKLLETLIAWGRYAELIDFDQNTNVVYLHEASESEDEDDAPQ